MSAPSPSRRCAQIALAACTLALAVFSLPAGGQQSITAVSGFRTASETDPFASQNSLSVASAPASISGLNGAHASVTVACRQPEISAGESSDGITEAWQDAGVGFDIAISGVNLDIVTTTNVHTPFVIVGPAVSYSTQDRSVALKLRFDADEVVETSLPARDTHHVSFILRQLDRIDSAHALLIGLSANGTPVNLRLNLREPGLKNMIASCQALKQRQIGGAQSREAQEAQAAQQQKVNRQRQADEAERIEAEQKRAEADQRRAEFVKRLGLGPIPPGAIRLLVGGKREFVVLRVTQVTEFAFGHSEDGHLVAAPGKGRFSLPVGTRIQVPTDEPGSIENGYLFAGLMRDNSLCPVRGTYGCDSNWPRAPIPNHFREEVYGFLPLGVLAFDPQGQQWDGFTNPDAIPGTAPYDHPYIAPGVNPPSPAAHPSSAAH